MILYKYTKINDYFFDMLDNEYFYCSNTNKFDDVFDGKMPFDFKTNEKDITYEFVRNLILEEIQYLVSERDPVDFEKFNKLLTKIDFSKIEINELNDNYDEESQEATNILNRAQAILTTKESLCILRKYIKKLIAFQNKIRICCFSNKLDNQVLWSMYANQYRGCCIEYDVPDEIVRKVVYKDRYLNDPLFAVIDCIVNKGNIDCLNLNGLLEGLILSKHKDWKFQEEFRVIDFREKIPCKIKSIILGYKISKKNEKKILSYNIKYKIKKMKFNYINQNFDFTIVNK